jgi:hypothetical protein
MESHLRSCIDELGPIYSERVKTRYGNFTVLQEPKLARRLMPNWTKADHEREAVQLADRGRQAESVYQHALDRAIAEYGDLQPGEGAVSGIYNRHFPEKVKDELRSLKDFHVFIDASNAHWKAAGKRGSPPSSTRVSGATPSLPPGTHRG